MLATGFNAVSFQQFDDACRGCRLEAETEAQVSRIDGMKTVDIFEGHGFKPLCVNLIGKGELNDESSIAGSSFSACTSSKSCSSMFSESSTKVLSTQRVRTLLSCGRRRHDSGLSPTMMAARWGFLAPPAASLDFFLDFVLDGLGGGLAVNDLHSGLLELSTKRGQTGHAAAFSAFSFGHDVHHFLHVLELLEQPVDLYNIGSEPLAMRVLRRASIISGFARSPGSWTG